MVTLDKKTQSLNQSGAFLQIHVLYQLIKKDWYAEVENPVTVAPFVNDPKNDPLLWGVPRASKISASLFPEVVAKSQVQFQREETSVDIHTSKVVKDEYLEDIEFRLCIEVKKNDPRYSDWCFFQQKKTSDPMTLIQKSIRNTGLVSLFMVPETNIYSNEVWVQAFQSHYWDPFKHIVCDFALALQNEEVKKEYYKSEKTKVDDAARQIIKGTYGLIIERVLHQVSTGTGYTNTREIFVPIVVTNANLLLCMFDQKDIDPKTGHITKDPKYTKVDAIIYQLPAPKEVHFPDPLSNILTPKQKKYVSKWDVLILSPKGLVEFLDGIDKIHR